MGARNRKLRGAGKVAGLFVPIAGGAVSSAGGNDKFAIECYFVPSEGARETVSGKIGGATLIDQGHDTAAAESAGRAIAEAMLEPGS